MKLILNIGLNNNPLTPFQIMQHLRNVPYNNERTVQMKNTTSTYLGEQEPTTLVKFNTARKSVGSIITQVEDLCSHFNQECIAITIDGIGYLVYNINYKGEKLPFDQKYFINF